MPPPTASTHPTKSRVLSSYRHLLKTQQHTFRNDERASNLAQKQIRDQFQANKNINDNNKIEQLIYEAEDATKFLRESVVQAEVKDNSYKINTRPEQLEQDEEYFEVKPIDERLLKKAERQQKKQQNNNNNTINNKQTLSAEQQLKQRRKRIGYTE
eukprot:gb/GECH01000884.1/.p1 GENE.gb/GECH01000884.1/~~gb/GECH01000884.1/.p1  ORF type:complete len:156 (+),score=56.79 gb/GECH01000884.1/:1-468(+)